MHGHTIVIVRYSFQITPAHGRHGLKHVHPRGQNHVQFTTSKILSKFINFFSEIKLAYFV